MARVLVGLALVGCGGGSGAPPGGGTTGRGGAAGAVGGDDGAAGTAGSAGTTGLAGTNGSAGSTGTAGTNGASGTGGAAGRGGAGGAHAAGGTGGMNCLPDILIVQDRSGSMTDDANDSPCPGGCGLNSKWAAVSAAVTNVAGATDGIVNWGLKFFPDTKGCSASGPPTVPIGTSNGALVANAIARTQPSGNTPTRDAITYATAYLQSLTDANPKFLLLATDGLPNCPDGCAAMANPTSACTMSDNPVEDMAAEAAVTAAATSGIRTFVVGIGALATAENTLNQLAIAGGEAQTGAATSYYPAGDEAALEAALTAIVNKIAGCPH